MVTQETSDHVTTATSHVTTQLPLPMEIRTVDGVMTRQLW